MQFYFLFVILITFPYTNGNFINTCLKKLDKGLNFIEQRFTEFNFDGLFGVVLTQGMKHKYLIVPAFYYCLFSSVN